MTLAPARWGADHWKMLLVVEGALVARAPLPLRALRVHPQHAERLTPLAAEGAEPPRAALLWNAALGSRLDDGTILPLHDDLDCLDDLVAGGAVLSNGAHPGLTDLGWRLAGEARRYAAAHGAVDGFAPTRAGGCPTAAPPRVDLAEMRVARDEPGHVDLDGRGLRLCLRRVEGQWVRLGATTIEPGHVLDETTLAQLDAAAEQWLATHHPSEHTRARMRDVVTCPKCGRRFGQSALVEQTSALLRMRCGPAHLFEHADGSIVRVERGLARVEPPHGPTSSPLDRLPRPPPGR